MGERAAERFLRKNGFRTLGRNTRIAGGELDLVMLGPDRLTVVVVEVKAKRSRGEGGPPPEANITRAKRAQLSRLTDALRRSKGWLDRPIRIDVVAVEFEPAGDKENRASPWPRRLVEVVGRWVRPGPKVVDLRHYPNAVGASAGSSRGFKGSRRGRPR